MSNSKEARAEIKGLDTVKRRLSHMASRGRDLTPLMRDISDIMADAVEENFAQEGRPPWRKLARSTIKQRTKKGYWPGKILQQRGEMAASVSRHYDNRSSVVGTNKKYAPPQNFGFDGNVTVRSHVRRVKSRNLRVGGRKVASGMSIVKEHQRHMKIPAREFMALGENDNRAIEAATANYMGSE